MFCIDFSFQAQASRPKPIGQREGLKNRENYFDTAGAIGINHTPFAASFICNKISFYWHKRIRQSQEVATLS